MIKPASVQEVIETAKVEEVIQDFLPLKRRGTNLIGLCPFHNEKTPSFTVSPTKNFYKCFGCGESGNAVSFLMNHEQLSFPEAIRHLAKKYGIVLEETEVSSEFIEAKQREESLFLVNEFARDFYHQQLINTNKGKSIGLSYFKDRGFTTATIEQFGLGFAPENKDALTAAALQNGFKKEVLQKLKLTNQYGGDFFRDRVMFTICNTAGKVVGFAGRTLKKDKKIPKYINSPETEIYLKSKILYGAHLAKRAIRKADRCLIVEGYTDVISLHQGGLEHVVASSGTSLTIEQIQLIKRFTENITILFDGDAAGTKAALRGLDLILEQGMNVQVVQLPEGEDPDSYMRENGREVFQAYLDQHAKDFIFFKTDLLLKDTAGDPIKRSGVIRNIVDSIAKIPDPIKRSLYIRECSRLVNIEEQMLVNELNQAVRGIIKQKTIKRQVENRAASKRFDQPPFPDTPPPFPDAAPPDQFPPPGQSESQQLDPDTFQERDIARVLISGGDRIFDERSNLTVASYILTNIVDVINDFEDPIIQKMVHLVESAMKQKPKQWTAFFINHSDPEISKTAIDLVSEPYTYSENWEKKWDIFLQTQKKPDENFMSDSKQGLLRFKLKKIIRKCKENQELIQQYTEQELHNKVILHLKVQQKLNEMRNNLASELGTVVF